MVSLGTRIRELRQERGLTQEQLGEKLLMRKSTISDYENDVIDIKISVLREIATALHVYPDYFLKGDDLNPKIRDAVFALSSITDERLLQAALDHIRVTSSVRPNQIGKTVR